MNFKYAIFDMDGTLIDSMPHWDNCERTVIGELSGIDLCSGEHGDFIYLSIQDTMKRAENITGKKLTYEQVLAPTYKKMYDIYHSHILKPMDGAVEYLKLLKENGVKIAIATATDLEYCKLCLEETGIFSLLDAFICTSDVKKNKYHPDVYIRAMEELGGVIEETMIFEDAPYAIDTVFKHGFRYTIIHGGACTGLIPDEQINKAEHLIHSYKELM